MKDYFGISNDFGITLLVLSVFEKTSNSEAFKSVK